MLFCKPRKPGIIYESTFEDHELSFRSFEPVKDIPFISHWISDISSGLPSPESLLKIYRTMLKNPDSHSFIVLSAGTRVCAINFYSLHSDELSKHMKVHANDCGMRLVLNRGKNTQSVAIAVIRTFLGYYFSFPPAEFMYATPDIYDHQTCRLLESSGFIFQQNIMLPSKAASLYLLARKQFEDPTHWTNFN